jgi:hypothetical protein
MDHSFSHCLRSDHQDLDDSIRNKRKMTLIAPAFKVCELIYFKNS